MDFVKALQSLEELLYEVSLWIIFLPKTLLKVVFDPRWIQTYVKTEWEKREKDVADDAKNEARFAGYLSPIFLFLLVAVVPWYTFFLNFAHQYPDSPFTLLSQGSLETDLLLLGMILLSGPLAFSFGVHLFRRTPFERVSVKRLFYTQCFCFAPFWLFVAICSQLTMTFLLPPVLANGIIVLPILWLIIAEIFTLAQELELKPWKAIFVTSLFFLGWVLFFLILEMIAVFVVGLFSGHLKEWLTVLSSSW